MRYNIVVDVPYEKKLPYTLYADGLSIEIPAVDKNQEFVHFKFLGGTVFCLFYKFASFRRAYIVTGWQDTQDGNPVMLPGISEKLYVLYEARGEKIDHLKRCLFLLKKKIDTKVFNLPFMFWFRLSGIIQYFGAKKSDINTLFDYYKKDIA